MILESLAQYLDECGIGRYGETLFVYQMPHHCESGILLVPPESGFSISWDMPMYFRDFFKFVIKSETLTLSMELAHEILGHLEKVEITSDCFFFQMIRPITLPIPYPRDETGNYEVEIIMEFSGYLRSITPAKS